jgi:hypothetical protein
MACAERGKNVPVEGVIHNTAFFSWILGSSRATPKDDGREKMKQRPRMTGEGEGTFLRKDT